MCGSYGLMPLAGDEPVLDEKYDTAAVRRWVMERDGRANTTRRSKTGINLNPVIMAGGTELAWWWLWQSGAPARYTAFNSRDDALLKSWRVPFQHRGLLPADWYSEGKKTWRLPDGGRFMLAAITAPTGIEVGGPRLSYSMVTRAGIGEAATVVTERGDSRMPLIVPEQLHDAWLDPGRPGDQGLVDEVVAASVELSRAMTADDGYQAAPARVPDLTLF